MGPVPAQDLDVPNTADRGGAWPYLLASHASEGSTLSVDDAPVADVANRDRESWKRSGPFRTKGPERWTSSWTTGGSATFSARGLFAAEERR